MIQRGRGGVSRRIASRDAGAVLIVETRRPRGRARRARGRRSPSWCAIGGAREVGSRATRPSAPLLWKARKRAFGAVGRLAPNYATQDGVVPRTRLPDILRVISALSERYDLRIGNVFHAGDGNIHPIILYDEREPDQVRRAIEGRPRDPEGLRRDGRQSHRRARNRRREARRDAAAVLARRPAGDDRSCGACSIPPSAPTPAR